MSSLTEVYSTNYVILMVGECEEIKWEFQEDQSDEELQELYRVRGMPFMEKEGYDIDTLDEIVRTAKEGKQQEIIIDTRVEEGTLVLIQEVLDYRGKRVGTYHDTTPKKVESGGVIYTGIVMDYREVGNNIEAQVYVLNGNESYEMWSIQEGILIQGSSYESYIEDQEGLSKVKLGGAIRFVVNESDITAHNRENATREVKKIDIITRYK